MAEIALPVCIAQRFKFDCIETSFSRLINIENFRVMLIFALMRRVMVGGGMRVYGMIIFYFKRMIDYDNGI
jgi:hypothetical protein